MTAADTIAWYLKRQNVRRIFGLCGGHIQPIWDAVARAGIEIIAVRHECSAIYMAQAFAELTGDLGVAMVTAGPGFTNALTGMANAFVSRVPILVISGISPRPQLGKSALQEIPQSEVARPICRWAGSVLHSSQLLARLELAAAFALGNDGPQGPSYIDFPTDLLRETLPSSDESTLHAPAMARSPLPPDTSAIEMAANAIRGCRRMLVIAGRSVRGHHVTLAKFLDLTGACYLDTPESRGVIAQHAGFVPAARRRVMAEADLIVSLGRKLDFQLAYGSSAVFRKDAKMIRVGQSVDELVENRRGDVEVKADTRLALEALIATSAVPCNPDIEWYKSVREFNRQKTTRFLSGMPHGPGSDGAMHPLVLIDAIARNAPRDAVFIADGGDILSFARAGLPYGAWLDCGPFGCLGVGVPFAICAALTYPSRPVIAIIGDGSVGFTIMEIETAVRVGARAVFVIANNAAWNIERYDQIKHYSGNVVGTDLLPCRYDLVGAALGAYGEYVEDSEQVGPAFLRALQNGPAVLNVRVTRSAVSPDGANGLAQVPDFQAIATWDAAERAATIATGHEIQRVSSPR